MFSVIRFDRLITFVILFDFVEVLNVSGNHLDSIVEFNSFRKLREFTATNNQLTNIRELIQFLSLCSSLKCFDTSRNPVCSSARYRERLIVVGENLGKNKNENLKEKVFFCLELLDGKMITTNARQFLISWKASREASQSREKSRSDIVTSTRTDEIPSGGPFFFDSRRYSSKTLSFFSFIFSSAYSIGRHANTFDDIPESHRSENVSFLFD